MCALFARGPFLGRQGEHWAELVAQRAELQHTADDAGAEPVVKDIITLLQETNVCQVHRVNSFPLLVLQCFFLSLKFDVYWDPRFKR